MQLVHRESKEGWFDGIRGLYFDVNYYYKVESGDDRVWREGAERGGLPPFIYTLVPNPSQANCVSTIPASHVDAQQCMSAPYQRYNEIPPPPPPEHF
jgi:hypothetical protein